jgi:hypothetical protein
MPLTFPLPDLRVAGGRTVDHIRTPSETRARLSIESLEDRVTPSIVLVNPAGNTPQGAEANSGVAIVAVNPAGFAPAGQNR